MDLAKVWFDADVSLDPIRKETVAVIGYGIQGHAQANNMRDSGLNVVVADVKGSRGWERALSDGHKVYETPEAVRRGDIILVLIPDMLHAPVFTGEIESNLSKGKALCFAHGASIHWGWVKPAQWVDVALLAPKAPGQRVREVYLEGSGVPSLVGVQQNYTGRAWERVLGLAKAIGSTRVGVIETTFKEEVETDWFGEQVDLCGGVDRMLRLSFEVLVEAGYQPEVAYFECLHELKLIVDLIQRYGIAGMYRRCSETARYGGLSRGGVVMNEAVKASMKKVLEDVQSGRFAREWVEVFRNEGVKAFEKYLKELDEHQIEQIGRRLRGMMWPNEPVV